MNAKLGQEECYIPIIGTGNFDNLSNENGTRLVNISASRYIIINSTRKKKRRKKRYLQTYILSPNGKTYN